jgi:hypothetical protein
MLKVAFPCYKSINYNPAKLIIKQMLAAAENLCLISHQPREFVDLHGGGEGS